MTMKYKVWALRTEYESLLNGRIRFKRLCFAYLGDADYIPKIGKVKF